MLTKDESTQLVGLLGKMEWPVPLNVFFALAEKTVFPGFDLALVTQQKEVLLAQRPDNDPYFAQLWHLPGAIVIPGQTAMSTIKGRLLKTEVPGLTLARDPEHLQTRDILMGDPGPNSSPRGQEVYRLFHYHLSDNERAMVTTNEHLRFYPLDDVPDTLIAHHRPSIATLRELHSV